MFGLGTLQMTAIAVAVSLVVGFGSGWKVKAALVDQARLAALEEARATERAGVAIAGQADVRYIDRLHEQAGAANARAAAFQSALEANREQLARCRVNSDLLGLLNAGTAEPAAGPAGEPGPAAAPAEAGAPAPGAGTSCEAVIETYRWNIDNVIVPNAIQLMELQRFYRDLRKRFNGR